MKASFLPFRFAVALSGWVCLSGEMALAQEKEAPAHAEVFDAEGVAYIAAKDETVARILKAERQRAKLLFMERNKQGIVLAFAIPQPKPEEIERFMAPLNDFIAATQSGRYREMGRKTMANLKRSYGFDKGKLRAVYVLIPADKKESLGVDSFPAETEAECESFIREDLKPVKLEIGKPYAARGGVRSSIKELTPGWRGEQLVKDRGLEDLLENWVDWHRKRGLLK